MCFDYSSIEITHNPSLDHPTFDVNAVTDFGKENAAYMLRADWTAEHGWTVPKIMPRCPLELDPSCTILHYAIGVFEGMKAYTDPQGHIRMFRPELNIARLNSSAARMALPTLPEKEVLACMDKLNEMNKHYVPSKTGASLYLRPTIISTHAKLGLAVPQAACFFVIACPSGPYFKNGFKPVSLTVEEENVRAVPGGTGWAKAACNYAGPILPTAAACKRDGVDQVVWTYHEDGKVRICEAGSMNFFVLRNEKGKRTLYTPELDGTILPGVTRRSVIEHCRAHKEKFGIVDVVEAAVYAEDLVAWARKGELEEMFGCGTAVVVAPIRSFKFRGEEFDASHGTTNEFALMMFEDLTAIQYGRTEHHWSHKSC